MSNKAKFSTPTFVVRNGDSVPIAAVGKMLFCIESDGNLFARMGDNGNTVRFNEGDKYAMAPDDEPFTVFYLINNSGADVTVTVGIGDGDIQVANSVNIVNDVTIIPKASGTLDSKPDVSIDAASTELVIAANASRRKVRIGNLITNTATFRIGDIGAGAANGDELPPGSSWEEDTTAAVYAYNPSGGAESLTVVEVL